jgi:hypothetical protein
MKSIEIKHRFICLCSLAVRVPGFDSRRYQIFWEVVGLERGPLSLVSSIGEQLGRNSSSSGLENREYGREHPLRWPCDTLYQLKLALTSPYAAVARSVQFAYGLRPRIFYIPEGRFVRNDSCQDLTCSKLNLSYCLYCKMYACNLMEIHSFVSQMKRLLEQVVWTQHYSFEFYAKDAQRQ